MTIFVSLLLNVLLLHAAPLDYEKVVIKNKESIRLAAFYHPPERTNPVVILLHGLASTKEEWLGFGQALSKKGWGWIAYDARGHGESSLTRAADGSSNGYRFFGPPGKGSEWERMIDDVGAAVQYLEKEKNIKRNRIALMGASLGANVTLNYAALTRFPGKLVLLSPGLNYQELKLDDAIRKVAPRNVLLVAHSADAYAFSSCTLMKDAIPSLAFWSNVTPGHGVQMFNQELMTRLTDWLIEKK